MAISKSMAYYPNPPWVGMVERYFANKLSERGLLLYLRHTRHAGIPDSTVTACVIRKGLGKPLVAADIIKFDGFGLCGLPDEFATQNELGERLKIWLKLNGFLDAAD